MQRHAAALRTMPKALPKYLVINTKQQTKQQQQQQQQTNKQTNKQQLTINVFRFDSSWPSIGSSRKRRPRRVKHCDCGAKLRPSTLSYCWYVLVFMCFLSLSLSSLLQ
jgi:hypothetical protein